MSRKTQKVDGGTDTEDPKLHLSALQLDRLSRFQALNPACQHQIDKIGAFFPYSSKGSVGNSNRLLSTVEAGTRIKDMIGVTSNTCSDQSGSMRRWKLRKNRKA